LNSLVQIGIKGANVTNFLPAGCVVAAVIAHH
jgi:hypothetical protein